MDTTFWCLLSAVLHTTNDPFCIPEKPKPAVVRPAPAPTPAPLEATATPVAVFVPKPQPQTAGGTGIAILERIKQCESGGNYTAQNRSSTASGAYQFLDSTWAGYGGYSRAMYAPPAVQDQKARETYARSGTTPWNASRSCWA